MRKQGYQLNNTCIRLSTNVCKPTDLSRSNIIAVAEGAPSIHNLRHSPVLGGSEHLEDVAQGGCVARVASDNRFTGIQC